jgi:hypothetical protein
MRDRREGNGLGGPRARLERRQDTGASPTPAHRVSASQMAAMGAVDQPRIPLSRPYVKDWAPRAREMAQHAIGRRRAAAG